MFTTALADAAAGLLARRPTRRSFLQRVAVVGSALSVGGLDYVLRPGTAYASVCGSGSTCASGWTALCCTINDGVNQCPPGSFAAGWWKADGASLCGGKARYYIDCQARCTRCHCRSGSHFCGRECWNCRSHCAHGGGCDERHVCRNLFRYGQCRQDIGCSGPVMCRAISCTPPWQWEDCTKASATDNFTRTHSAPCLPNQWTPMQKRYAALRSQASPLGASIGPERRGTHGHVQRYENGRMYHSDRTGTHFLLGALAHKYHSLGESASALGLPTSDTTDNSTGAGRHNLFEHGSIHSSNHTGAHVVTEPVFSVWADAGMAASPVGLPITDTRVNADGVGRHNEFELGAIYFSPTAGIHTVPAVVLQTWDAHDREAGPLGYPTSEFTDLPNGMGQTQEFEHGVIDLTVTFGTHAVWGPIFDSWVSQYGRETGTLGLPMTDVYTVDPTHDRCDFEHGSLVVDKTTGAVTQP
jgi:hypothetical protein